MIATLDGILFHRKKACRPPVGDAIPPLSKPKTLKSNAVLSTKKHGTGIGAKRTALYAAVETIWEQTRLQGETLDQLHSSVPTTPIKTAAVRAGNKKIYGVKKNNQIIKNHLGKGFYHLPSCITQQRQASKRINVESKPRGSQTPQSRIYAAAKQPHSQWRSQTPNKEKQALFAVHSTLYTANACPLPPPLHETRGNT